MPSHAELTRNYYHIIDPEGNLSEFERVRKENEIWANENILPEFELITYKAIQTIAGNNTENYSD